MADTSEDPAEPDARLIVRASSVRHAYSGVSELERIGGRWHDVAYPDSPSETLTEALEFGTADRIEIETDGVTVDEVLAALMPADYLIEDEVFVTIDGTAYGPFFRGGWLELDMDYRARGVFMPIHRPLAGFTEIDFGPDPHSWVEEVGEVRPGMLIRYHEFRHAVSSDDYADIVHCPPQELYLGHVRELLFEHGADFPELDEAIRRTIDGEGSSWTGDQLSVDGPRTVTIDVSIDPEVAAVLRTEVH